MDKDFNEFTEEDFESKDFNEEAFRQKVINAAQADLDETPNIGESIQKRKNDLAQIKDNFNAIWAAYKALKKARNHEEWQFIDAKVRTLLYAVLNKLLSAFVREGTYDEIMKLNDKIDLSLKDLREEKDLLRNMRSAIKELEKYDIDDCNYDMALLLALINEKNDLLMRRLNEEVRGLGIRLRGIDYYSNSKIQEDLDLVSENIDYKVQKLELTHKY